MAAKKGPAEAWEWQELLPRAWAAEPDPSPAMPQHCHGQLRHSGGSAQLQASNAAKSLQIQRDSHLDSRKDLPRVISIPVPQTPLALPVSQTKGVGHLEVLPVSPHPCPQPFRCSQPGSERERCQLRSCCR